MKIVTFFLAVSLFMSSSPLVEKAKELNDRTQDTMALIQRWAEGRAKPTAVDEAFLKIINTEVPKELDPYKLLMLRILFQYELALEIQPSDPYTSAALLKYLTTKLVVYKALLEAYIQGTQTK